MIHGDVVEKEITKANGAAALVGLIFGELLSIGVIILSAILFGVAKGGAAFGMGVVLGIIGFVVFAVMFSGLKVVHPNEAAVYTFFGRYYGTIKKAGYYFINPFASIYNPSSATPFEMAQFTTGANETKTGTGTAPNFNKKVSTKTMTFNNHKQKVNDALGNPIVIGAAVIWKVVNPTKAVFNVENYNEFLSIQCDAIVRNNARLYPYDVMEDDVDEKTLRGSSQEIAENMKNELQARVEEAGIEIKEVRITHLAYSEEIAAAMLQRQQAVAIIAARQKIVEGAVSMVKMAIDQLSEEEIVSLDEERKAAMVSNLLVVLCGNKDAQPIVNSGSIY
ncbi:MAG: SPFH domain-containing protein [Clostridium sp.]|nr:SPFH domain-containing protein [Clostridium sp.]MCM1207527.1 SPFH domain-containing protein [Ruminococcus sp.]